MRWCNYFEEALVQLPVHFCPVRLKTGRNRQSREMRAER